MTKLSPRFFVLPVLAVLVIGALPAPVETSRADAASSGCGPAIGQIADTGIRAALERFDRTQSAAAAKICAFYRNNLESTGR
ncbi:MAG TPA: hypothetical protein VGD36_19315 [Xanthobacteraceae bacterium]|jgi:hypothetical protein